VFVDQIKYPFRPQFPMGPFLQKPCTFSTTDVKIELIAEQRSQETTDHDPWQFKISAVCCEASQDKHRFTFKEGANCDGGISVC